MYLSIYLTTRHLQNNNRLWNPV